MEFSPKEILHLVEPFEALEEDLLLGLGGGVV